MDKPEGYVNSKYLHMKSKLLEEYKARTYQLMKIRSGDHVLDVGCWCTLDGNPIS